MTNDSPNIAPRIPRWVYVALIASVALNLLFVGGLGAAVWRHRHGPGLHGPGLMGFVNSLPSGRQSEVRDQVEAARTLLRPLRKAKQEAWAGVKTAMEAEPFDKPALKAALQKLGEADQKLKSSIAGSIADTAEKLSPAERRQLQSWLDMRGWNIFGRSGHRFKAERDGPNSGSDAGESKP